MADTSELLHTIVEATNILFNLEQESGPGKALTPRERASCKEVREHLDRLRLTTPQAPSVPTRQYVDAAEDIVTRAMVAVPFLGANKETEKLASGIIDAVRKYEIVAHDFVQAICTPSPSPEKESAK